MANYVIVDQFIGNPTPVTQVDTVQRFPLGLEARAVDMGPPPLTGSAASGSVGVGVGGGVFRYVQGSNGTAAGQVVYITNGSAVLLSGAAGISSGGPLAVQAGALTGTAQFGWAQVQGVADYVKGTNHAFAAGIALWPGSTAGMVGSVSSAGGRIYGMYPPVSNGTGASGAQTFMLERPFVLGMTGSI